MLRTAPLRGKSGKMLHREWKNPFQKKKNGV
jgi:hypothetical protein